MSKAKPKLQDTLEVFLDDLESLKNTMQSVESCNEEFDKQLDQFRNFKPQVDTQEMKKLQREMERNIEEYQINIKESLQSERKKLEKVYQSKRRIPLPVSIFTFIMILLSIAGLSTGLKFMSSNQKLEKEVKYLKSNFQPYYNYLNETKQIQSYQEWLGEHYK